MTHECSNRNRTPRTILFIHGMFLTGRSWSHWVKRFERAGYHCLAPSWPGRDGAPRDLRARPPNELRELTLTRLVDEYETIARETSEASSEPPILVGHSMGGLIVQLLLAKGIGACGVAIDSAPPQGVRSFAFTHLRANLPILWPGSSPITPSFEQFRYAFWHTGSHAEVRALYDTHVVPESRLVGRGPLGLEAQLDFGVDRPPLLLVAGGDDTIIPESLNRENAKRYRGSAKTTLIVFPKRTHAICAQTGWEDVADRVRSWIEAVDGRTLEKSDNGLPCSARFDPPDHDHAARTRSIRSTNRETGQESASPCGLSGGDG